MGRRMMVFVLLGAAIAGIASAAPGVTFESLVREMTDLGGLTRFPDPPYVCKQFSSYDRKSTDPTVLTDENWFANGDAGQHLRVEERDGAKECVMMDADGPGAIVRIWSANPDAAGILRIYIDAAPDPTIEMPLIDMLRGETSPFLKPIACETSRGWSSYLPIPYAKHCKVTASNPGFYYHVNYRTYPAGTEVESYSPALAKQHEAAVNAAVLRLAAPSTPPQVRPEAKETVRRDQIQPGGTVDLAIEGPAAIHALLVALEAPDMERALRACLIEITFDGETPSQVLAPLGDFFGTAPGLNSYESLPSGTHGKDMYSFWVMPFAKSAKLSISNHIDQPVWVSWGCITDAYDWSDRSMHFHAKWRGEYPIHTRPRQDWTFLDCKGKGVFVGDMLHVTNPVKQWWGEGDEKIYVDGETFPSHFGTGSEDYYGYAWCCPQVFTHAYHNQPRCDGPGNYGQTCVSRFHVLDNIPFTTSFKFDMEVWHWAECDIAMAATSYWYAAPGATDTFQPPAPDQLKVITPPPLPPQKKAAGALEGEGLKVVSRSGGEASPQAGEFDWSGGKQLWWIDAKPGDTLVVSFSAPEDGRYEVRAAFTKAADYGIARLSINGKRAGEPMDFYNDGVVTTGEVSLGVFPLRKGDNELKIAVTGANKKAIPRHMFGLDYLLLKPAK